MTESPNLHSALSHAARLLQENEPKEAMALLLPLYDEHPDDPDVAVNLGGAYILQRKWNQAVAVLEAASRLHPDNPMIWTNLAASYLGSLEFSGPQQQTQAIEAYQQALRINPYTPNVHYDLGLIYKDRHEYAQAIKNFRMAIKVNPSDRDARLWLNRMEGALAEQEQNAGEPPKSTGGESAAPDGNCDSPTAAE